MMFISEKLLSKPTSSRKISQFQSKHDTFKLVVQTFSRIGKQSCRKLGNYREDFDPRVAQVPCKICNRISINRIETWQKLKYKIKIYVSKILTQGGLLMQITLESHQANP